MEMQQPIQNIAIVGDGLRAWLPAAYLSARFPAPAHQITVVSTGDIAEEGDVSARPNVRYIHQVLQITEQGLATVAKASPALSVSVAKADNALLELPYGNYGLDQAGAEFYQYWRRADMMGKALPLEEFNLALKLAEAGKFVPSAPNGFPKFDYGYTLSRGGYCSLLQQYAERNGVQSAGGFEKANLNADGRRVLALEVAGSPIHCDMVIDTTASQAVAGMLDGNGLGWTGNCLSIGVGPDIPGIEIFLLQSAMERFIALLPDQSFNAPEIGEYNRLAHAEQARIDDMVDLLRTDNRSPELVRKLDVFGARGRVAIEDYEVFTKAEWIAALTDHGIKPEYYDRLVDRVDPNELVSWLNQLETAIKRAVDSVARG
jgi:hypothetical protein